MHHLRLKNRGDVSYVHAGDRVHSWTGDDCPESAAHQRVRRAKGSARNHACVDCGNQARQWSYNHKDPNGRTEEGLGPYSSDPKWYEPRCVSCHKKFDLSRGQRHGS
jgi:hypothetical protein